MYEAIGKFIEVKNPRFVCDRGWPEPGPAEHVVSLEHVVTAPLDSDAREALRQQVGDLPEVHAFYERYGSLRLYAQKDADESAFYIASPDEWMDLKDSVEDWLVALTEEEVKEHCPSWIGDFTVIGEVPKSGSYFLIPFDGENRGKVFEFEHDGFEFIEVGENLLDFVKRLCTVDPELLERIAGQTRYVDHRKGSEWMVASYVHD